MPRLSTEQRLQQAADRLQQVNAEQARIAKEALDAIDNGADPETTLTIAQEAVKEALLPKPVETDPANAGPGPNPNWVEGAKKIRVRWLHQEKRGPFIPMAITLESGHFFELLFDENGIAFFPEDVADHLRTYMAGSFVVGEED
ncbi:hypothetical protein EBR57_00055 [bacterium]|nr:hypothetical protein [bacterium]